MNILILGAGGFIGTNLTLAYLKNNIDENNHITVYDYQLEYFEQIRKCQFKTIDYREGTFDDNTDFDSLVKDMDIVYHMISTTIPATSNQHITDELYANVIVTTKMLDACVRQNVKKIVFISSGGAVYGKECQMPLKEITATNPISSYGIQKITIEKLLYLYEYLYGLDYRIIRLANPYGPYQRPNGGLGVVTTFVYRAMNNEPIVVYGDGSVVRDFIYIDDAVDAILNIVNGEGYDSKGEKHKTFNVGSGKGISVNQVIECINEMLNVNVEIQYREGRKSDVPVNYLDISLYEEIYGKMIKNSLSDGIIKTKNFLEK